MSESSYPRTDGDEVDDVIRSTAADVLAENQAKSAEGTGEGSGRNGGGGYSTKDLAALEIFSREVLEPRLPPDRLEPGALPSTEPLVPEAHEVKNVPPGFDAPPQWVVDAFSETPVPIELSAGTAVYRFIGQSDDVGRFAESLIGSWWTLEVPRSEAEWHSSYAVKGEWNMDGGYVEVKLEHPVKVWIGGTAAQEGGKSGYILKGGAKQVWVRKGRIDPREHGVSLPGCLRRSPWNKR